VDEMDMTLDNKESIYQKNNLVTKRNLLPQKMNVEQMEKGSGEVQEFMMHSKIEVKLGQLLKICLKLKEMMTKSLLKMGEAQIVDVYKVTTTPVEDFDEAIPIVQVRIGKFRVKDVLLNSGSNMNIISENLKKKSV
jgi:hypothetical protein